MIFSETSDAVESHSLQIQLYIIEKDWSLNIL